jgi:hypothetical protein
MEAACLLRAFAAAAFGPAADFCSSLQSGGSPQQAGQPLYPLRGAVCRFFCARPPLRRCTHLEVCDTAAAAAAPAAIAKCSDISARCAAYEECALAAGLFLYPLHISTSYQSDGSWSFTLQPSTDAYSASSDTPRRQWQNGLSNSAGAVEAKRQSAQCTTVHSLVSVVMHSQR